MSIELISFPLGRVKRSKAQGQVKPLTIDIAILVTKSVSLLVF